MYEGTRWPASPIGAVAITAIMWGIDDLVKRGIADSNKLTVAGWSYGGYMTRWIIPQTRRFNATMVVAGLSHPVSMYGTTDTPNYIGTFFKGRPSKDNLALDMERSGITYVDHVTTPELILQRGEDQPVSA